MKRPNSSDSLGALMSIGPRSADEEHPNNQETTTMSGFDDECCVVSEKKRRLSNEQVKALEKYFEVENKLEPERKVKLALELGLQPRQVAVWFQNRRARWKTKNLERDFGVLKANYDALKQDFETLQRDNESLFEEIRELKSKLNEDVSKSETQVSARKEEPFVSVTALELDFDDGNSNNNVEPYKNHLFVLCDSKDGSSDSDSSAILNDDDKNNSCIPLLDRRESSKIHNGSSSPTPMNVIFQLSSSEDSATNNVIDDNSKEDYQPQAVKIEENNLFGEEDESCTTKFFSDEQAPTLNWYNPDEWN